VRTGAFWSKAAAAPLVVLSDFDFTISQVDVGDLIVDTLSPPTPELHTSVNAGAVGSRVFWQNTIAQVDMFEALALAESVGVDPGFAPFARWCEEAGVPVAVVSDGFGFYVSRILRRDGLGDLPIFCNEMPEPGQIAYPHGNPACDFCACCKPRVSRRVRELGARVIYIGDGISDLYAAAFADWVFAKGRLARHMEAGGSPYYPLESFAQVLEVVRDGLPQFLDGTAPGRCTLGPSEICKFPS